MGKQTWELVFEEQGGTYLNPSNCGAQVSYWFTLEENLFEKPDPDGRLGYASYDGTIDLTDCNRKISWSISSDPEQLAKLDRAIVQLKQARAAAVRCQRAYQQACKRLKYKED